MTPSSIRLCLVLHNHQPVGNFDDVIEQAYQQSYRPFLDLFEEYSSLRISLHTSGPLMQWLDQHHPDYLDRLQKLVSEQRLEIVGGAYYEPILTMIPARDRRGQIQCFRDWLEKRFHTSVRGMWIPERVWEASLVSELADAGVDYTILDDFHFRCAGLAADELCGDYVTEDQGKTLRVFPGSERLRYAIPFQDPQATIDHLKTIAERHPGTTVVFADDGEKFGTWPDTYQHVYEQGWLRRFFDALVANQNWLHCSTLADSIEHSPPRGKVYLPDASYREMTEWAYPVSKQLEYDQLSHEMENDPRWPALQSFIRGGFWRNFKQKYEETNEMYARMMYVSQRLDQASQSQSDLNLLDLARDHLFQGQCNCPYWHGAFGGVYLPHLRNAVYQHLILADQLIDQATGESPIKLEAADFNFDLDPEIRLSNDELIAWFRPSKGGQIYELDVRSIAHNLLATLQRRPESYHEKVRRGPTENDNQAASIHDRVVFKQNNLDQNLAIDTTPRKSLLGPFLAS